MVTCTGRAANGSAAMPPPSVEVASRADRLTPAHRKELVDPLCLRWPGSASHVGTLRPARAKCAHSNPHHQSLMRKNVRSVTQ
jgi:hypothetical protein